MSDRSPLPRPLAGVPFTVDQARTGGVSRSRLRGGDLETPFRAVRVPTGFAATFLGRCQACQARMHPEQFFSHLTAARIHGLPMPWVLETDILDVSSVAPRRPMRAVGVRGHELRGATGQRIEMVRGVRVLDPVSVWLQLAPQLTVRELVVMGDALVRRQNPITSIQRLRDRVALNAGSRGQQKVLQALAQVRERTDSPRESELRLDLVAAGLPEPAVNPEIRDSRGRFLALGDLTYREHKVLVEYDGQQHRTDDHQFGRDVTRLNALNADRWIVIRVTKDHWASRHRTSIPQVRDALLSRGWQPNAHR